MKDRTSGKGKGIPVTRLVLVSIAVIVVVGVVGVLYHNKAFFQPDAFAANRELQENQVVFPGEEDYQSDDSGTGESDYWEQEEEAQEELNPEEENEAEYLFENNEKKLIAAQDTGRTINQTAPEGNALETSASGSEGITVVPATDGDSDIVIGSDGNSGSGISGGGSGDSGTNTPGNGGNGNGGSGNSGGIDGNTVTPTPAPTYTPVPTGSPAPTATPTPNPTEEPLIDPDPQPQLPQDMYDNTYIKDPKPAFPEDGITVDDQQNVELWINDGTDEEVLEKFYYGAVVSEWKLLCATYAYVLIDGQAVYRLVSYGDNFKVEGYPTRATEDFDATFSFRVNRSSEWIKVTHRFKVYPYKVVIQGDGEEILDNLMLEEGQSVNLLSYYNQMLPSEAMSPGESKPIEELFVGWSETEGGEPVAVQYTPGTLGRHVLYNLPRQKMGDAYSVCTQLDWDVYFPYYLQTLNGYGGSRELLDVPYGIHSIQLYGGSYQRVRIPASVLTISTEYLSVTNAYEVSRDNLNYCSEDGMLFNKKMTELCGIPTQMTELTIPENVDKIVLLLDNKIQTIHMQSENPPEINLDYLQNVKIYVPSEFYLNYLKVWGNDIGSCQIYPEENGTADYVVRDGAIFSKDGTVLYQILASQKGTYTVPDGVKLVKTGALQGCKIDMLVLPDSVGHMEASSMSGESLYRIIMEGETPPQIEMDTFADSQVMEVCVTQEHLDTYLAKWMPVLGDATAQQLLKGADFEQVETDGYVYWLMNGGALLAQVPEDITVFSADSLPGVTFTEIQAEAFAEHNSLEYVEIPQTVTRIGGNAFYGCVNLQAILIQTTDTITVGSGAFSNCWELRCVVSYAMQASFADSYLDSGVGYCLTGAQGYPEFESAYTKYWMKELGEGQLLYGTLESSGKNVLLRATGNASGEIVLESGTMGIEDYAFQGCMEPLTLSMQNTEQLSYIGRGAFSSSGLAGHIDLPQGVSYLGEEAFSFCSGLESVYVEGSNLMEIGDYAFYGCDNLQSAEFSDDCRILTIDAGAFGYTALQTITIPQSVTNLGCDLFDMCSLLANVYFQTVEPPRLLLYAPGVSYVFGAELPESFRIILPEEADVQAYIDAWKYPLLGATSDTELTEEEQVQGENLVRELLGMEAISPETESKEESSGDEVAVEIVAEGEKAEDEAAVEIVAEGENAEAEAADEPIAVEVGGEVVEQECMENVKDGIH